ncbi:hypothetical protein L211DRAFT_834275 [Terfezia boudieri ATCC MYA-4762]|uniref:Uncharacterized protein n=1 Tax=Terfezia boudieri ATCC MYA-4762 TaxID=1051890 RepID=A0A3N4LX29_9PEZI|nr:hypothetical protein L211DRAFT_834275 [Terfezia boudieri ATCC MYA-4762]
MHRTSRMHAIHDTPSTIRHPRYAIHEVRGKDSVGAKKGLYEIRTRDRPILDHIRRRA